MYRLQARPFIIQPGNFTGWGSEEVNAGLILCSLLSVRYGEMITIKK